MSYNYVVCSSLLELCSLKPIKTNTSLYVDVRVRDFIVFFEGAIDMYHHWNRQFDNSIWFVYSYFKYAVDSIIIIALSVFGYRDFSHVQIFGFFNSSTYRSTCVSFFIKINLQFIENQCESMPMLCLILVVYFVCLEMENMNETANNRH